MINMSIIHVQYIQHICSTCRSLLLNMSIIHVDHDRHVNHRSSTCSACGPYMVQSKVVNRQTSGRRQTAGLLMIGSGLLHASASRCPSTLPRIYTWAARRLARRRRCSSALSFSSRPVWLATKLSTNMNKRALSSAFWTSGERCSRFETRWLPRAEVVEEQSTACSKVEVDSDVGNAECRDGFPSSTACRDSSWTSYIEVLRSRALGEGGTEGEGRSPNAGRGGGARAPSNV